MKSNQGSAKNRATLAAMEEVDQSTELHNMLDGTTNSGRLTDSIVSSAGTNSSRLRMMESTASGAIADYEFDDDDDDDVDDDDDDEFKGAFASGDVKQQRMFSPTMLSHVQEEEKCVDENDEEEDDDEVGQPGGVDPNHTLENSLTKLGSTAGGADGPDAENSASRLSIRSDPGDSSVLLDLNIDNDDDEQTDDEIPQRRRTVAFKAAVGDRPKRRASRRPISRGSLRKERARRNIAETDEEENNVSRSSISVGRRSVVGKLRRSRLTSKFSRSNSSYSLKDSSGSFSLDASSNHRGDMDGSSTAAAAAAVIAASAQQERRGRGIQFGQGEFALVQLSRLGLSELSCEKDLITVAPVNKYGYPIGEGKTFEQKRGPFIYVLCKVVQVHFDEDERYYTVSRLDIDAEQRADTGFDWMQPIRNEEDIEIAFIAAKKCRRSELENQGVEKPVVSSIRKWFDYPINYVEKKLIPSYQMTRNVTKVYISQILRGDNKFTCDISFTGINLLVLSSFIYYFLEVFVLVFIRPEHDQKAAIVGLTVWMILAVELIFEFVIRPSNYYELMRSDKAFAPSTARYINWFHVVCEVVSLLLFIPQMPCAFSMDQCGLRRPFSLINATLLSISSTNNLKSAAGRFYLGLTYFRAFGLVRHWKQMWINHTFDNTPNNESSLIRRLLLVEKRKRPLQNLMLKRTSKKIKIEDELQSNADFANDAGSERSTDYDKQLKEAATIGTALTLVNSHRALFLLLFLVCVFPIIYTLDVRNPVYEQVFGLLQSNNVVSNTTSDCDYLRNSVTSWLLTVVNVHNRINIDEPNNPNLAVLWAQVLPVRCDWQRPDGVITFCGDEFFDDKFPACSLWKETMPTNPDDASPQYFARVLGVRPGELTEYIDRQLAPAFFNYSVANADETGVHDFYVRAIFNDSSTVALVNFALFLLLMCMLALVLIGLTVMRVDAERLVLGPLQRMLKIVVRYAENPLSTPTSTNRNGADDKEDQLGHFETEQLINAIAKIADLLRKCWGVAGAGIISSNLARTKSGKTVVFNPTIPGKRVYALFGFVGINEFDKQLRRLDKDVMKLINDVARVVHDEVYRWALGDSGQCNKNLGGAFLMVFRIGDFTEVHDRKKRATDVVFNSQQRKGVKVRQRGLGSSGHKRPGAKRNSDNANDGTLQLASLPGIQGFTDRALLGFLKSFAGLHRDQNMQKWEKDFRLSAGVGTFTINVIFGMDAGWAVEGAVGSEYKIDATYLSPHVNMASRMMSACKQYGVTLLMSQAVEELLSRPARAVMRHLDTVYVKGSNVAQRIYTHDARFVGVDFFLFERSPEQADVEADAYTPGIWTTDQDLKSMRQHVSEEFRDLFAKGVEQYIEGDWTSAIKTLQDADYMMLKAVVEEGFVNYDYGEVDELDLLNMGKSGYEIERIRNEYGDGACKCLVQYMQRREGIAPADWHGVRKLDSK